MNLDMTNNIPKVEPILSTEINGLVQKPKKLFELVLTNASPLHILFPEKVKENISEFEKYFSDNIINGKIYYAHKANRSYEFVEKVRKTNAGIEVSSESELDNALFAGFKEDKILCNGPKDSSYFEKAVKNKCIIGVNSISELKRVVSLSSQIRVFLRFSNITDSSIPVRTNTSRFGIDFINLDYVEKILEESKIDWVGFSFHLDSTFNLEKQIALKTLLKAALSWIEKGISVKAINIGGGFRINYVSNSDEWEELLERIQTSVMKSDGYLWNSHSFGYYLANKRIRGEGSFYPYYSADVGVKQLDKILKTEISELSTTAIDLIRDLMLEVYLEPGRALLNQAGITVMKISEVEDENDYTKITLEGNYKHITADQDIMYDPILISEGKQNVETDCFIFGNLCLENDVILKRKIRFSNKPEIGDLLLFANTAAYKMDFSESQFIHHKLPKRIAYI